MRIDTPLLVVGQGPAALVVAKVAARCGLPCLLVGHEVVGGDEAVALGADAVAALERHGALDILRPYLDAVGPPAIAPRTFEEVLKQHCVADVNVTVYDRMTVVERVPDGAGVRAVLTDGRARWEIDADALVDAALLPTALPDAITFGAAAALDAVSAAGRFAGTTPRPGRGAAGAAPASPR